jgi:hypothetical protein
MRRRTFLGAFVSITASSAVIAASQSEPDAYWSGWRQAPNQLIEYGWWARRTGDTWLVSTTFGVVQTLQSEGCVVDLTHRRGWPWVTPATPQETRDAIQERARLELMAATT